MAENQSVFGVQIGTVYSLETDVLDAALQVAGLNNTNVGVVKKSSLAGPNDIIFILSDVEFWRDLLPWAATAVAGGVLGALGRRIFDRYFPGLTDKKLDQIDQRQRALGYHMERLLEKVEGHPRYFKEGSEVRIGFPVAGQSRNDPGVTLKRPREQLPLAIGTLVAASDLIEKMVSIDPGSDYSMISVEIKDNRVVMKYLRDDRGERKIVSEEL